MTRVRVIAEVPLKLFQPIAELLQGEGCKMVSMELVDLHRASHTNKAYSKPAQELVHEHLKSVKSDLINHMVKTLKMPTGTVSSSLHKLKKEGRVVRGDVRGKWAIK
jgi:hypothetical protein